MSARDALLSAIRDECREVAFDWPSSDTERSGPPERTIFWDENALRNAPWHRERLLAMVEETDASLAQHRKALLMLVTAVQELGLRSTEQPRVVKALSNAQSALSISPQSTQPDHAELLPRLPGVDADFAQEVLCLPAHELQRRVLIQKDWLQGYAQCLDGLSLPPGLPVGVDGARLPHDIRRIVTSLKAALERAQAKSASESISRDEVTCGTK